MPASGYLLLAGLCLAGSWSDIANRRLPNWLSLATLVTGLIAGYLGGGFSGLGWHALHMAVALAGGMGLFALGAIGAGDAKFYAGVAAWFPFQEGIRLFVGTAMAGLLLLVVWVLIARLRNKALLDRKQSVGLPYGVAISLGAISLVIPGLI